MTKHASGKPPSCCYEYQNEPGRICPYPQVFSDKSIGNAEGSPRLPIDSAGLCIFHSTDEQWKARNEFSSWFLRVIDGVDARLREHPSRLTQLDRFDCRGFVFSVPPGAPLIDLSYREFRRKLDLVDSRFLGKVDFEGTAFYESAYFERACFHGYAHFTKCRFAKSAYFDGATFDDFVVFRDTEFRGVGSFVGVQFPTKATTYFENISIGKALTFKGIDRRRALFSNAVSISLLGKSGSLSFENVNLNCLDASSRAHIAMLESSGRATVGPGCNKYRVCKEVCVPYRERHKPLLMEIAQAFVELFNYDGTLNGTVGVEIEYMEDSATIRYFSDLDVPHADFEEMLAKAVPIFIKFLRNPEDYLKAPLSVAEWDAYRRVKLVQLGLLPRIALGKNWSFEDTLNVVGSCPGPIGIDVIADLHQHYRTINLQCTGNVQLVAVNASQAGTPISIAPVMGDNFSNISDSTIVNRSTVTGSGNTLSSEGVKELRDLIEGIRGQLPAGASGEFLKHLDRMHVELAHTSPDRTLLKSIWEGVARLAPQLGSVADAVGKVSALIQ